MQIFGFGTETESRLNENYLRSIWIYRRLFKNLWKSRAWYGMMISYYIMALFGKEIIAVKEKRQQKENFAKWREPKKRW